MISDIGAPGSCLSSFRLKPASRNMASNSEKVYASPEGVLASIISCDGRWCRLSIGGVRGYIEQTKLWGAYQGEVIN